MTICPIHGNHLKLIEGIWQCRKCIEMKARHAELDLRKIEKSIAKFKLAEKYPYKMHLLGEEIRYTTLLDNEAKDLLLRSLLDEFEKSL